MLANLLKEVDMAFTEAKALKNDHENQLWIFRKKMEMLIQRADKEAYERALDDVHKIITHLEE